MRKVDRQRWSNFTGRQIAAALQTMGTSHAQFARLADANPNRVSEHLRLETNEEIPSRYDLVLFVLYHHPELRVSGARISVPMDILA